MTEVLHALKQHWKSGLVAHRFKTVLVNLLRTGQSQSSDKRALKNASLRSRCLQTPESNVDVFRIVTVCLLVLAHQSTTEVGSVYHRLRPLKIAHDWTTDLHQVAMPVHQRLPPWNVRRTTHLVQALSCVKILEDPNHRHPIAARLVNTGARSLVSELEAHTALMSGAILLTTDALKPWM